MGWLAAGATILVVGALTGLAGAAQAAPALTVDEMIARHVAARGGDAALKTIKTMTFTGKFRPPGFDADLAYDEVIARPGSARINITLQGLTVIQSYDGASGWQVQPFGGRKDPETLSADDVKSLQEEADFEDPLVDHAAKGAVVTYLGLEDVDGAPTHALHVTLKNGDSQTWYLDPDLWLAVRVTTHTIQRGVETVNITDYGDYEQVAGVWFAFEQSSGTQGQSARQLLTYDKVVVNGPIDPNVFARPAVKPAAAH